MARVWMLADPCADPWIFARVVQARLPKISSVNGFCLFFCPQLLQFYSGLSMVYFKENYNLTRFQGGGSNLFQGRGLGVQMQIVETHRTFDFPGGGADPLSPLWIRTCDHLRGSGWGVWYSLFIKNLAHVSSHKNFGLFIKIRPIIH